VRPIYVQWLRFQRRPLSMAAHFGFEVHFLSTALNRKWLRLFDYAWKAVMTVALLVRQRPDCVWVASGPVFAVQTVLLTRRLTGGRYKVVADCHNSTFLPPWSNMPFARAALDGVDACLIHNDRVLPTARALGVAPTRLLVLEDRPADPSATPAPAPRGDAAIPGSYVVFPCGFRADEPLEIVLDAARRLDPVPIFITGDHERMKAGSRLSARSGNVRLTGFLERAAFEDLLGHAGAVLGLTDRDGVQLSVANEAVGFGLPMVLSDTATLRSMFPKGVIFVETASAENIAQGCRAALAEGDRLRREVQLLRRERIEHWEAQAERLQARLRPNQPGA